MTPRLVLHRVVGESTVHPNSPGHLRWTTSWADWTQNNKWFNPHPHTQIYKGFLHGNAMLIHDFVLYKRWLLTWVPLNRRTRW
jgi:hypothetical protein